MEIVELGTGVFGTAAFRHLLWLAVEVDEAAIDAIIVDELPGLRVQGAVEGGAVTAFVAYEERPDGVLIDYLASAESQRGTGLGRALLAEIAHLHPHAALRAQTDDDAIGFYRSLGFADSPAPPDPRWPDRPRYDCVLAG
ncbi:acetyltransferase (GNAT) family protein [Rathayibacter sp. PhB152]|uniref:GNAT family N-acetyltransferase n=1 Tax=unclassified Rathayibacter TaxID=2609250 RepID=UPI000F4BED28|nr:MULTISPECIES: GNAT family N-acetyltransferase [unclassified Rathayibacter]ROQ60472.1 acetyltransferase (GNAT) family protein [Rathayibacter sp. PhB152]ROS21653.1 acetyltransferase (GNAT) family protein [Rathayibacter sp. PhB127]TDX77315.1 acetyltransferase (GNAT) family protein [Rathayibacter sp. PhB151]